MAEFGFFVLGLGLGAALVLSIWNWWLGRNNSKLPADVYTDYHKEYYAPVDENDVVDAVIAHHVVKGRKKRIKARKKPVSKTRKARRAK